MSRTSQAVLLVALLLAALAQGCGTTPAGNGNTNDDNAGGDDGTGGDDGGSTDVPALDIASGETQTLDTTEYNVDGDATIEGALNASGEKMVVNVSGDLTINGTVTAGGDGEPVGEYDPEQPFSDQPVGIYLVVDGDVTIGENAVLDSDGPIVITDDPDQLLRTAADMYDEADSASGDLPTMVPLPPDDEAFTEASASFVTERQAAAGGTVTIRGLTDVSRMRGDRPVVLFRFDSAQTLNIDNWTLRTPPGRPGADADNSDPDDSGTDATGANGKRGMNLLIWNNNGAIKIQRTVTLNLTDGGDGGDATAECASATGGDGAKAGNFRMVAAGGVDISNGELIINPGRGGHGGNATVTGLQAADGCPGETGCDATATGGNGADNKKRLFIRGTVTGVENITLGQVIGGNGGAATADAGDGGNGEECCDGGTGGAATAEGGAGGAALVNVGGLGVDSAGAMGGDGGASTATGGDGGNGGDCKLEPGGNGGAGGAATATGGAGGSGAATGGGGLGAGGNGGDATSTGGDGGDGGDSAIQVGTGGAGGTGTATEGAGGAGDASGIDGTPSENDGLDGADGQIVPPTVIFCFSFAFLASTVPDGSIPAGTYTGPVYNGDGSSQVGTMPIQFLAGGEFSRQSNPNHIGYAGGTVQYDVGQLALTSGAPGDIIGLRLVPLYGQNVSASSPVVVTALDAGGQTIGTADVTSIPDNSAATSAPETIDVTLDTGGTEIAAIQVYVPPTSFVTFLTVYILDP